MRRVAVVSLLFAVLAAPAAAQAPAEYPGLETGKMWTFDVPPLEYWKARYNFTPDQAWLAHARLSAVRYGGGCSASFVSPEGLVMTNHHCARGCIESATRPGEDFLSNGFLAPTRAEERPCQGLVLDQLQEITDVTPRVSAAVPARATDAQAAEARRGAIRDIERECGGGAADRFCQVVTMYRGGQYKLYRFRRFNDVRLVFAPEAQIAFFGGDPDNFTYPRHDLDVSFVRAYVDGEPARTEHFRWSAAGSREGELVFVIGNPGSTGRLNTMAQLEFLRDVQYPATLAAFARMIPAYQEVGRQDSAKALAHRNTIFGLQNSQKAITGYRSGLLDSAMMARKAAWEREFRAKVQAEPALRQQYGDAWGVIEGTRREAARLAPAQRYHTYNAYGSRLLSLAGLTTRYPAERALPDSTRRPQFRDANKAALERSLFSGTAPDPALETLLLAGWLEGMAAELPPADPVRTAALGNRTPMDAARALVAGTKVGDPAFRRQLAEAGVAAVQASDDPLIALARAIEPHEARVQQDVAALNDREAEADTRIARALLAVYGSSVAPDATFSLRITDGEVKSYPANGTQIQPYTTFHGLYDRSAGWGGKDPWHLPARWVERRTALDLATPLNGVSTNDIIGGNSGSPVINRNHEIVGLIFDGNIEMLPGRFLFTEAVPRSVWVDSRGLLEALRKVYQADALAAELAPAR
ncbi:MAG TPA: S46 family peptidase [Gemmatimonadales bacterium]|nr:S46 family peptidase [Gemmatimonadales bacterium]